ncbi:uncharacterized protein LOC130804126 [Amaranthus tricolor]|uniref:uncharacterized protein LOC130804126 n=1 Tax=Amaranthus tricolor TaxID=29722 RepID=UPI0025880CED|nr:uncharacterized protein LOC130804126 [Amaranthus tricolor]XP_057524441.1 uncharacterized protein LOC130804126 [Amaranthus tricolor]
MAVSTTPVATATEKKKEMETQKEELQKKLKRSKDPGIRVVGGRIYDPQNGKTCHQCRQKTMDFTAGCMNMKGNKQCTIKFCHKCLLNRYGEKAEEMEALGDWNCPKCRDICNCSCCRKKKDQKPTGILSHTAKATGFSSVSELLHVKGPDVCQELIVKNKAASSMKSTSLTEGCAVVSPKKRGKENLDSNSPASSLDGNKIKKAKKEVVKEIKEKVEVAKENGVCSPRKNIEKISLRRSPRKFNIPQEVTKKQEVDNSQNIVKSSPRKINAPQEVHENSTKDTKERKIIVQAEPKVKACKMTDHTVVNVVLPPNNMLNNVASIDLLPEDSGHALQFLEFCSTFGEVLDIRKGQAESVLRDIVCGRKRRGKCSSAVQFLTQLLSFILKDADEEEESVNLNPLNGKDSWINSLKRCLDESELELEDFPEHCLNKGSDGYEMLETSQKLKLLCFLCDESLSTKDMRNWIEEQNLKLIETEKEAKSSLNAAKEKEKQVKHKLQEKIAKAVIAKNGVPLTISEHDAIISKIRSETERARAELLEAMELMPKKRQRSDAVRTEPVFIDDNGRAFWRLKCYGDSDILLQDFGAPEQIDYKDKWSTFNGEDIKVVESYISSVRLNRHNRIKHLSKRKTKSYSNLDIGLSSDDDSNICKT